MSDKPVILQVLPRMESGGVERGTIEITQAISQAGMTPLIASAGGALLPHIRHAGGEHITLPLDRKNPFVIRSNAWRLYLLIKSRGVNIVHARSRAPAWSAYYAAQWAGVHFMSTFHGIYGTETALKKRYNSVMTKGKCIIAVSNYVKEHILANYHVDADNIRVIPRGVDFNLFDEAKVVPDRLQQLTRGWGLYDNFAPVIFAPGRLSRIKGFHVLIEALAKLPSVPFLCIIAGSDQGHEGYRRELQELVLKHGLEGKVRIEPNTQFMTEAYTLANIVVIPSIKPESFGRVAIEAQAMGNLVIASDHGGVRETIIPNETGYLVPPNNAEMLAEAIRFALGRDERVIEAMSDFARQHVRTHYDTNRMKAATIDVYRELLATPSEGVQLPDKTFPEIKHLEPDAT